MRASRRGWSVLQALRSRLEPGILVAVGGQNFLHVIYVFNLVAQSVDFVLVVFHPLGLKVLGLGQGAYALVQVGSLDVRLCFNETFFQSIQIGVVFEIKKKKFQ